MIFDWDLWPGLIGYESDWGHVERMRRGMLALKEVIRAAGLGATEAMKSMAVLAKALRKADS